MQIEDVATPPKDALTDDSFFVSQQKLKDSVAAQSSFWDGKLTEAQLQIDLLRGAILAWPPFQCKLIVS